MSLSAASSTHGRPAPFMNARTMRASDHRLKAAIAEPSATPKMACLPITKGEANVSTAPVRAMPHSAARRPDSSSGLGIVVELFAGLSFTPFGLFGLLRGLAHGSI